MPFLTLMYLKYGVCLLPAKQHKACGTCCHCLVLEIAVLNMQAADLLAIEEQVQAVCSALATRIFDAQATCYTTGMHEVPQQVFLYAFVLPFESLVGTFTVTSIFLPSSLL
jgi:hypothetical protein